MTDKKYTLEATDLIAWNGEKLWRVVAVRSFPGVSKCDRGGMVAKEANLAHDGDATKFQQVVVAERLVHAAGLGNWIPDQAVCAPW